jgi:phosphoserine / homoserine phosphotransferase
MHIVALDLEGVLIPEIWISVAERTGIPELKLTTRDVPDYDVLMRGRLAILDKHGLGLPQIQATIAEMDPLPGAKPFLEALRARHQVIILSDTFYDFAEPFMRKLGWPTLFCHALELAPGGRIVGYRLRQADPKRHAVRALKGLNFRVVAAGDSYNDVPMLSEAHAGVLFRAPENVIREYPQYPHVESYEALDAALMAALDGVRPSHL